MDFEKVGVVTVDGELQAAPTIRNRPGALPERVYRAEAEDGAVLALYVWGRGTDADAYDLLVRCHPGPEEAARWPTFDELMAAVDLLPQGAAFACPPFLAGGVYPEATGFRDVPLQQIAVQPGSPAARDRGRFTGSGLIIKA